MTVWILFIVAILVFLALDLGVFNKTPHIISSKEAGKWTGIFLTSFNLHKIGSGLCVKIISQ